MTKNSILIIASAELQSPLAPLGERVRVRGNPCQKARSPHPSPLPEGEGTVHFAAVLLVLILFLLTPSFALADGEATPIPLPNDVFKVENDQSELKTERVATIEYRPTKSFYIVRGQVQYRDVEGTAYLEMWNVMPDGNRYFSRTLAEHGTMQKIQGTSDWREFELPFNLMEHRPESVTLEINVVMPGKGTIELSGLMVLEPPTFEPTIEPTELPEAIPTTFPDGVLIVENNQSAHKSERIATIEYRPTSSAYVVRGKVRYNNVEAAAYLEMWNVMPDGSRYFSRTLAEHGTMQKIQGTSDWREFVLPFNLMEHRPEAVTLEINVVMPGKGTIELSELSVSDYYELAPTTGFMGSIQTHPTVLISVDNPQPRPTAEWFNARLFGEVLAIFWVFYGALFVMLYCFLLPRGRGRRLVLGLIAFAAVVGVIVLVAGITALLCGQPFRIWFWFIHLGSITTLLFTVGFFVIRYQYKQAELRKMQALDA